MESFPECLRCLRDEAGFKNGYAFFKASGGRKAFGCTFRAYQNVEDGLSIPRSDLALRIGAALGLWSHPERAGRCVAAYLRALTGSVQFTQLLASSAAPIP